MNRIAIINENTMVVENISTDDREVDEITIPNYILININDMYVDIGMLWDGTSFNWPSV
jgi:hypothetical protein